MTSGVIERTLMHHELEDLCSLLRQAEAVQLSGLLVTFTLIGEQRPRVIVFGMPDALSRLLGRGAAGLVRRFQMPELLRELQRGLAAFPRLNAKGRRDSNKGPVGNVLAVLEQLREPALQGKCSALLAMTQLGAAEDKNVRIGAIGDPGRAIEALLWSMGVTTRLGIAVAEVVSQTLQTAWDEGFTIQGQMLERPVPGRCA